MRVVPWGTQQGDLLARSERIPLKRNSEQRSGAPRCRKNSTRYYGASVQVTALRIGATAQ
jgi:hypothetical protein